MNAHSRLVRAHTAHGHAVAPERLPTNTTAAGHAVHRWFNFVAGFSPELVNACASMTTGERREPLLLLDPFAGCGTAPLAARLLGLKAIGYDPHPFFSVISEAKANSHRYWASVPAIGDAIRRGLKRCPRVQEYLSPSACAFLGKMFDAEALAALVGARLSLAATGLAGNPLAILILSRILDHCCFAATDGIYKAPTSSKRALAPRDAFERVMDMIVADALEALSAQHDVRIHARSSETMSEVGSRTVNLIVTSPPYLNNFDFAEMTRMYLYFWGMAGSWGEISDTVRSRLIVNTTTALRGHKDRQADYRATLPAAVSQEADDVVAELAAKRRIRSGKKDYDFIVYPYLSQMQAVIRECARVMKVDASFHMMVSDAALYGVHIPAPSWLGRIMSACGFYDIQVELVRRRGHRWVLGKREGSDQGLGEYYVFAKAG